MKSKSLFVDPSGATPIEDASGLKLANITTRRALCIVEATNIAKAQTKYLAAVPSARRAPFDRPWAYKLHEEMFCDVWKWAGEKRQSAKNIGVPHYEIDTCLHNLLADLAEWARTGSVPLMMQSVQLHHRAVQIHPFENGNGRWARLLANVWLKRCRSEPVVWPDQTIGETSTIRDEYIRAIKAADQGNYEPLLALHKTYSFR